MYMSIYPQDFYDFVGIFAELLKQILREGNNRAEMKVYRHFFKNNI